MKKGGVKYENTKKERRNAADVWTYVVRTLAVIGWVLFVFALFVSYYAAPEVRLWHFTLSQYRN